MTEVQIEQKTPLLRVTDLKVHFPIRGGLLGRPVGWVKAVDGVSFVIRAGETFGVVGESGCGKSTVGNAVLRMVEPTSGLVEFDGQAMSSQDKEGLRQIRRRCGRPGEHLAQQSEPYDVSGRRAGRHAAGRVSAA